MKHLLTLFFVFLTLFFVSWGNPVKKSKKANKASIVTKDTTKKVVYVVDTLTNDTLLPIHLEEEKTEDMPQL